MRVQTQYTPFHTFSAPILGKSFAIVPNKAQEGSLEFKSYASCVKNELTQKGLVEKQVSECDYVIFMDYNIDNGKTVNYDYPIFGQTGTSGSFTSGYVNSSGGFSAVTTTTPTFGIVGSGQGSAEYYTRVLKIEMAVKADFVAGKINKVYECKATSQGSSNQLSIIVPIMVHSIFQQFPGESGKPRDIWLPLESPKAKDPELPRNKP
jgi:hypothetical protein